jgi:hypothetical protein
VYEWLSQKKVRPLGLGKERKEGEVWTVCTKVSERTCCDEFLSREGGGSYILVSHRCDGEYHLLRSLWGSAIPHVKRVVHV